MSKEKTKFLKSTIFFICDLIDEALKKNSRKNTIFGAFLLNLRKIKGSCPNLETKLILK